MSHYPGHLRDQFISWVDSGCSDVLPGPTCEAIAQEVGVDRDVRGMSYALGASVMLVKRAAGDDAAGDYLLRVLGQLES
jgi:hypothetical protein